jgi:hypothetical protein
MVADELEGSVVRGAMPDDARRLDLEASALDPHDLDQTDQITLSKGDQAGR